MADFELQQIDSLLLTLQDVLRDKFALESEIEALPLNLSTQKEELAEANRKYLELNEKYNKAKEEAAKYAVDYDEAFQERTNAEKMMDSITTQREYEALSKQIEEAKVRENGLLRARNNSNSLVEDLRAQLEAQGQVCDSIKADVDAKNAEIDSLIAEKKERIAELDSRCLEIKDMGFSDEIYVKFSVRDVTWFFPSSSSMTSDSATQPSTARTAQEFFTGSPVRMTTRITAHCPAMLLMRMAVTRMPLLRVLAVLLISTTFSDKFSAS